MNKRIIKELFIISILCLFMFILIGCECKHEWKEATCTDPKTCIVCGKIEGVPLGHDWIEATCINPKPCTRCGEKNGEHDWKEATCTEPKTCLRCGATEGEPNGHSVQEWKITKHVSCTEDGIETGVCVNCGQELTMTTRTSGHTFGEWTTDKKATCTENGSEKRSCIRCGKEEQREYELTKEEKIKWLKNNCKKNLYNDIVRNPTQYTGQFVQFSCKILQVRSETEYYSEYWAATKGKYDNVILLYINKDNYRTDTKIHKDDKIKVYGIFEGTYTTLLDSSSSTIPSVIILHYE